MKVRIVDSKQVWKSPDGQRILWNVAYQTEDGRTVNAKTYSQPIGEGLDQEKDIVEYTKPGRDGNEERFIKLAPKEGGYSGGGGGGGRSEKDSEGMAWGNALTNAITFTLAVAERLGGDVDVAKLRSDVIDNATYFFENRPDKKPAQQTSSGDTLPTDAEVEQTDNISTIFPGAKYDNI